MSFGIDSKKEKSEEGQFFEALKDAHVEPLEGSEYEKNDTLDKYIYEPISPIKKNTPHILKTFLSFQRFLVYIFFCICCFDQVHN